MPDPYSWIDHSLATVRRANWYRSVQAIASRPGPMVVLEGQSAINFASNDYLGLAGEERLIEAAVAAARQWGTGSTGSRLVSGHRALHVQLEDAIAQLKQTEAALVFSSGYLANLGAIAALVGQRDLILADQYNHSSLKNGAILSGATVTNYAHCDIEDLTVKLEHQRDLHRRCLILTDSVFSMDGDLCPLSAILDLAQHFNSMVMIDEAHATGVLGATGAGCVEHFRCTGRTLIQMGTLSKALGSSGGYIAGSAQLIDFLRNRAPTWIYTTALSPPDTAAALAAIEVVHQEPERRDRLWQNVRWLKEQLQHLPLPPDSATDLNSELKSGLKLLPSESPILCLQVANPAIALTVAQQLKTAGIFAPAIRPPTVPTSRIRLSVMATHERDHLQQLMTALKQLQ